MTRGVTRAASGITRRPPRQIDVTPARCQARVGRHIARPARPAITPGSSGGIDLVGIGRTRSYGTPLSVRGWTGSGQRIAADWKYLRSSAAYGARRSAVVNSGYGREA